VFGPIGCGRGKTLATQMLAERAKRHGIERSVLVIPAQVYTQFFDDLKWARTKVPLSVWFHRVNDSSTRKTLIASRKPGCYVTSYELLSQADQTDLFQQIQPDYINLDEAHFLARQDSSRTKRFKRYVEEFHPIVTAFSGTMTGKSIKDYWHIIKACLRLRSPLPTAKTLMEEWAKVLDSDAEPSKAQAIKFRPLVEWARKSFPRCLSCNGSGKRKDPDAEEGAENVLIVCKACHGHGKNLFTEDVTGYRKAYTLRLNSAPGVVSSPDDVVGTALAIENLPIEDPEETEGWEKLQDLIAKVEEPGITPAGEVIEHAIHGYKWLYELSAGFYNEQFWPTEEVYAKRKSISLQSAKDQLDRAKKHLAAQQLYAKELRDWLKAYARPKLDSPLLVAGWLATKGAPPHGTELLRLWKIKNALAWEGMPERDHRAVRVCSYKIDAAARWAQTLDGEGGIVWIWNEEIGEWVAEALRAAGLPVLHCPAGPKHNDAIRDVANANKIVVASIKAHGTGKNLQHFWNQFAIQWPRSAKQAEQLIARTHREGQKQDEVVVHTSNTTAFDHANFYACLNDALYIHQTGGGRQRLVYGQYRPLPRAYPSEWLRERGFEVKILTTQQRAFAQERFGPAVVA
jgi:hypothetical protein